MKRLHYYLMRWALIMLVLALSPMVATSLKAEKHDRGIEENTQAIVSRDPGDVSTLDLFYGSGGKAHAPDSSGTFTFVKEDMNGTSPKFDVTDDKGVEWKVKLGEEPQAETAATRLLWAAGYFTDEDYFLADLKVDGLPKLHRGEEMISSNGTIHHARMERHIKGIKKLGTWDWVHNRCGSSQEFNGLRIMMAFVNNWDLKSVNNSIEEFDGERRCVVSDVGATFGKTGSQFSRSKSVEKDFEGSEFVIRTSPESVDFVMHTRPFILSVFDLPYYRERTAMENITKHIPVADAKWLAHRLALLSVNQIQDIFRSAGYTQEDIDGYTKAVRNRIADLEAL